MDNFCIGSNEKDKQSFAKIEEIWHFFIVGSFWHIVSVAINRFVPNILFIILASLVQPSDLGVLSYIFASYTVLSLFADFGITYALQKFIQERPDETGAIAFTAMVLRFLSSLTLASLCLVVDAAWKILKGRSLDVTLLLVSSVLGTTFYVLNARLKYKKASLLAMGRSSIWFVLSIILVLAGQPIMGPVYSLAFAFVSFGILAVFIETNLFCWEIRWDLVKRLARFGWLMTLASAFSVLAAQAGVLMLTYLKTDSEVAIYKVASIFGLGLMLLGEGLILPLFPLIKQSLARNSKEAGKLFSWLIKFLVMIGLLLFAEGIALTDSFIWIFFGPYYQAAVSPMRILLGAGFFGLFFTVLLSIPYMSNGLPFAAKTNALVAIQTIAISILLIPKIGLNGTAFALLFSYLTGACLIMKWLMNEFEIQLEWRKYSICILAAIEMLLLLHLISLVTSPKIQFVASLLIGPVIYFILLFFQKGITRIEVIQFLQIVHRRSGEF